MPSPTSTASTLIPAPSPTTEGNDHKAEDKALDEEAREAEREITGYGGDVPTQVRSRALSLQGRGFGRRTTQRSGGFPDLHLVDSAFSDAHRELSRVHCEFPSLVVSL